MTTIRLAKLTPPQSRMYMSKDKYPLFVAGFGAGKSTTLSVCAITDLVNYPGADIGCYAPTYDTLRRVIEPYLSERLNDAGLRYRLNRQEHIFSVSNPGIGDIICRSLSHPDRIIGYEVFRSHVDELDTMRDAVAETAWNQVIARNRQKLYVIENGEKVLRDNWKELKAEAGSAFVELYKTHDNRVSAYTTPEGFKFAYRRWERDGGEHYKIYRASTYSNPHLVDGYIEGLLASYPKNLIEAYLHGRFVNLNSAGVYVGYDRELNRSTLTDPLPGEPVYIGMDFNVVYGASVAHVIREECPHAIAEVHDAHDTDTQINIWNERYSDNPIHVFPDATGKRRSSANSDPNSTDIAKLKLAGWHVHVEYTNPMQRDRINCVNAMLCNGLDERRYRVNPDTCPHYAEGLEQMVYDDNGYADKGSGYDHITEAAGYFIAKRYPIIRNTAGYGRQAA